MNQHVIQSDMIVVGAGLVGLAAAVACHQAGYQVTLVDSKHPVAQPINQAVWDTRIYAISPKNAAWLQRLGVWQLLDTARICQMESMALWADATEQPLILAADDINADQLGFIVEAGALMQALLHQLNIFNIKKLFNCQIQPFQSPLFRSQAQVSLEVKNTLNEAHYRLESPLLLAADGSHSWVREQLHVQARSKPYEQVAVVANFKVEKSHDNRARQWFKSDSANQLQVLAWLPLPERVISIVWAVSNTYAETLLAMDASTLAHTVMQAGECDLGEMQLLSPAAAFPLTLETGEATHGNIVFMGDAAHRVHPMAGQGVNLGFRDVIDLIDVLKEKNAYQQFNDAQLLKRYSRERKADVANMVMLTDGLFRLFNHQHTLIKKVRHWGFEATKQHQIKQLLVSHAVNM